MKAKTLYIVGGVILLAGASFLVYKTMKKRKKAKEQPVVAGGTAMADPPPADRADFGNDLKDVTKETSYELREKAKSLIDQML